jgi:hypothetical protein
MEEAARACPAKRHAQDPGLSPFWPAQRLKRPGKNAAPANFFEFWIRPSCTDKSGVIQFGKVFVQTPKTKRAAMAARTGRILLVKPCGRTFDASVLNDK